jgi:ATP-binding cassette subfamily F protein 2
VFCQQANLMRRQQAEEDARLAAQLALGEAVSAAAADAYAAALARAQAELAEADSGAAAFDESKMGALSRADGGVAADKLSDQGVVATFAAGAAPHRNAKDIAVENLSVTFHGAVILEGTDLQLSYGNRCAGVKQMNKNHRRITEGWGRVRSLQKK